MRKKIEKWQCGEIGNLHLEKALHNPYDIWIYQLQRFEKTSILKSVSCQLNLFTKNFTKYQEAEHQFNNYKRYRLLLHWIHSIILLKSYHIGTVSLREKAPRWQRYQHVMSRFSYLATLFHSLRNFSRYQRCSIPTIAETFTKRTASLKTGQWHKLQLVSCFPRP